MKYPPYACQCCGIANADMYYDWYRHKYGHDPDQEAWDAFQSYRQLWEENKKIKEWNDEITGGKPISSTKWITRYKKIKKGERNEAQE